MAFRDLMVNATELDRLATEGAVVSQRETVLMKVTAATAISGATKRWKYTVQPARVGAGPTYTPALEVAIDAPALSVSELSNDTLSLYSYGVDPTNLPGSFDAKQIPVGAYVLCVPHAAADGEFIYLIVNTQAIDGTCT